MRDAGDGASLAFFPEGTFIATPWARQVLPWRFCHSEEERAADRTDSDIGIALDFARRPRPAESR